MIREQKTDMIWNCFQNNEEQSRSRGEKSKSLRLLQLFCQVNRNQEGHLGAVSVFSLYLKYIQPSTKKPSGKT